MNLGSMFHLKMAGAIPAETMCNFLTPKSIGKIQQYNL